MESTHHDCVLCFRCIPVVLYATGNKSYSRGNPLTTTAYIMFLIMRVVLHATGNKSCFHSMDLDCVYHQISLALYR
jgi:uncharacterized membrane protein YjdF